MNAVMKALPVRVNRWFLRCFDCCAVTAVETNPIEKVLWQGAPLQARNVAPPCECGGRNEIMGRVGSKDRMTALSLRCPCDSRCTNATGPNCECSCGGENHGTHRVVCIKVDASGVPRTQGANLDAAKEFRAAVEAARERIKLMPFHSDFVAGKFIHDRAAWEALRSAPTELSAAKRLKSHAGRMKALARVAA